MAPPDLPSRPGRPSSVFGLPESPPADAGSAWSAGSGSLGPDGVWPPPRPSRRARDREDDPPTVPLLLAGAEVEVRRPSGPPQERWHRALLRRLVPRSWRGARVHPGRPGAIALVVVAAGAAVVAAIVVWTERPRAEPVSGLPVVAAVAEPPAASAPAVAQDPAVASTAGAPAPPPEALVVSVAGKVRRPGLVEVPPGARVADVLDAAGGVLPGTDLATLNLARRVADGEQVAVGVPPATDAAGAGPAAGPAAGPNAPAGKVDLNTATVAELDALPGVGPVMATRILDWRARNGRFSRVDQLREIEGIGERRFGQLRELVRV